MESISQTKNTFEALSDDLSQVVDKINRSVVAVNARRHLSSSGVYWRDGVIVTAAHAIRRTEDISVLSSSGQIIAASFAGADPSTDLALLKVNSGELSLPTFGDTSKLQVGGLVLAVGRHPQAPSDRQRLGMQRSKSHIVQAGSSHRLFLTH
jgi:S1-C subfamily serine protease